MICSGESSKPVMFAASPDGHYKINHRLGEVGGRLRLDSEMVCLFEEGRDPRLLEPLLNRAVISAALSQNGVLAIGLEPFPPNSTRMSTGSMKPSVSWMSTVTANSPSSCARSTSAMRPACGP